MKVFRRGLARLGGFAASAVVNGIVNIVAIPFVIASGGESGWASVAVGQSIGAVFSVFVLLGWLQTGPLAIARGTRDERGSEYLSALYVRGCSAGVLAPLLVATSVSLGTPVAAATVASALSMVLIGLGPLWFYVGEGSPNRLMLFDTLPRCIFVVAGTLLVVMTGSVVMYALLVATGALVAVLLASFDILRRYKPESFKPPSRAEVFHILGRQRHGILTSLLASTYISAPVLLVQLFVPPAVPEFALMDKLRQQALTALRPLSQVLQGWTPNGKDRLTLLYRVRIAWKTGTVAGVGSGIVLGALTPLASEILGAGVIEVFWPMAVMVGVAFGCSVISSVLGTSCLVPLGAEFHVTISAAIAMIVTLGAIVPLVLTHGATGAMTAVALGQLSVALYQSAILFRRIGVGS